MRLPKNGTKRNYRYHYKTLTLWTYHPGMNKVMALSIMECQNENTQMIKHFLQTFNKCLQDYTGIDDYKFDHLVLCVMREAQI